MADQAYRQSYAALTRLLGSNVDVHKNGKPDAPMFSLEFRHDPSQGSKDALIDALNQCVRNHLGQNGAEHHGALFFANGEGGIRVLANALTDPNVALALSALQGEHFEFCIQQAQGGAGVRTNASPALTLDELAALMNIPRNELPEPLKNLYVAMAEAREAKELRESKTPLDQQAALALLNFATGVEWNAETQNGQTLRYVASVASQNKDTALKILLDDVLKQGEGYGKACFPNDLNKTDQVAVCPQWITEGLISIICTARPSLTKAFTGKEPSRGTHTPGR